VVVLEVGVPSNYEYRYVTEELTMVTQSGDFIKNMNAVVVDGTPRDVKPATDDTTFERKSRDLVKLYR